MSPRRHPVVPAWNNVSGSPFSQVAQPWVKGYTYNAEFAVHYEPVWLDR